MTPYDMIIYVILSILRMLAYKSRNFEYYKKLKKYLFSTTNSMSDYQISFDLKNIYLLGHIGPGG